MVASASIQRAVSAHDPLPSGSVSAPFSLPWKNVRYGGLRVSWSSYFPTRSDPPSPRGDTGGQESVRSRASWWTWLTSIHPWTDNVPDRPLQCACLLNSVGFKCLQYNTGGQRSFAFILLIRTQTICFLNIGGDWAVFHCVWYKIH